jgi:hypothetical protein
MRLSALDTQSRYILRELSMQTCIAGVMLLAMSAVGAQSWIELGRAGVRVFQFYGFIDCVRAAYHRETLGGVSLNRWDQAIAYIGCALLLHAIVH